MLPLPRRPDLGPIQTGDRDRGQSAAVPQAQELKQAALVDGVRDLTILVDSEDPGCSRPPCRAGSRRWIRSDQRRRGHLEQGIDLDHDDEQDCEDRGDDDEAAHDDQAGGPLIGADPAAGSEPPETTSGRAGGAGPPASSTSTLTAIYWILPSSSLATWAGIGK